MAWTVEPGKSGHEIGSVRHGTWWLDDSFESLRLLEYLTAPIPAYGLLRTALHRHGPIEQVPEVLVSASW